MLKKISLGIVGATGVVGQTALDLLDHFDFDFEIKDLKLFASKSSAGKSVTVQGKKYLIEEINLPSLETCHAVIFASEANISKEFIPLLSKKGILCVDKSSVFRMDAHVPLVVPEVNSEKLLSANKINSFIVASPNCVAIPLSLVTNALHKNFKLKRMIVSTYQSVSGSGKNGLDVLTEETKNFFLNQDLSCQSSAIYPKSIAFNVFPFVECFNENGQTGEEHKIIHETRKILAEKDLPMEVTSVRVPIFVGHCMSVTVECADSFALENVYRVLSQTEGVQIVDKNMNTTIPEGETSPDYDLFMTPREVQGTNDVFVSRIRKTDVFQNGLSFWIACDNLRKGAALNALQIVNHLQKHLG